MTPIGMIGIGHMGHSVAANILQKGHAMRLFDVRPEAMEDLLSLGASRAASIEELGECGIVLIMVNTYAQCLDCLNSLLKTMHAGVVIVCSTIQPEEMRELERLAAARGVQVLDAPVSGGTRGAHDGTLTIMAAGSDEVFQHCLPILQCFGSRVLHVGTTAGQGQALKAVNQLLVGIHICAAAEAFNMARSCGLDLNQVFETIKASAGTSRIFENRGQFFIDRDFSTRSTLAIQLKDTSIACKTAAAAGAPAFLGNLCRELFEQALCKYPSDQDSIAVIQVFEAQSGTDGTPSHGLPR